MKATIQASVLFVVLTSFMYAEDVGSEIQNKIQQAQKIVMTGRFSAYSHMTGNGTVVAGGAMSAANGGSFRDGFIGGLVSAGISGLTTNLFPNVPLFDPENKAVWAIAGRTAIAGVSGGIGSVATGGKFAQAAFSSAFFHLFNNERPSLANSIHAGNEAAHVDVAEFETNKLANEVGSGLAEAATETALNFAPVGRVFGKIGSYFGVITNRVGAVWGKALQVVGIRAAKATGRATTDIIAGPNGLVNVRSTIDRINAGGKFPHRNDGSIFQNREGLLPKQPLGYYKEFVHPTPGAKGPGAQRIIQGQSGELFYTPDHYGSFIPLN